MLETPTDQYTPGSDAFYDRAYVRHRGLISEDEQQKLKATRVAIAGLGGMGGTYAAAFARSGIGHYSLADFDTFEPHNINRQFGATASTIGKSKVEVMAGVVADINPAAGIKVIPAALDASNIDDFLDGVDIIVDALDVFSQTARRLVFAAAREKGIPVFSAAPLGFSAVTFHFHPEGMSYDEFSGLKDGMTEKQMALHFICAIGAQGPHLKYMDTKGIGSTEGAAPSVGIACSMGAAIVVADVIAYVLGKRAPKWVPHFAQFDPFDQSYKQRHRRGGAKNLMQRIRMTVLRRMIPALND